MPNVGKRISWCGFINFFCCPPCPNQIADKLAFLPPSPPNYEIKAVESDIIDFAFLISPNADTSGMRRVLRQEARLVRTSTGNNIAVLYVKCTDKHKYTLLYSHGNAVDIGLIHRLCTDLSLITGCDVVTYDYSGYGVSEGHPTEKNMYADIRAAFDYILTVHEPSPEKIVLYGQSLGTVPTLDLASKTTCAGVVLQTPLLSAIRVVCPKRKKTCMDKFNSIEKVPKVTSPVLVIHGTNDEIIDFSHGQAIYERCPRAVEPLWVEGAGHNDIELYGQYVERLRKFINEELSN